jgi:hypothetical protein
MSSILDKFEHRSAIFRPKSATDFFALQLAVRLSDEQRITRYVLLSDRYSADILVQAYARARDAGSSNLADRFDSELNRITQREESDPKDGGHKS